MKVGMVVEKFDPLRGGLEQWTYRLVEKLARRGHEIHVVSREFSPRAAALPLVAHQVRRVHSPLAFAAAAEEKLASLPLDVIHDMGVGWYCDIFHPHGGSWASVTARKVTLLPPWLRPLKNMLHRVMPRYHIFRKLMARQYADHGQIMVALSRCVADDFVRFHQVAPQRIRIVYNGVDAERFSPARCAAPRRRCAAAWGSAPTRCSCCWWPQISRSRGSPRCCGAWPVCVRRGLPVQLLVVGGKRPAPWRRLAARLGVAAAVRFTEAVEDLVPYYAAADLYAHPTIYDTCSLVVLEAAACGLPVVTTRCNGAAELFHDGRDIVLAADPADDEHFAAAIQGLLVSPAARRALGEAARRTALAQSFDRNVDNVEALYEEVVERRARPAGDPLVWSARVRMSGAVPRARPADAAHAPPPASRTAPPRQFHPDVGAPR